LLPSDEVVRAVLIVGGGIAPACDIGCGQPQDVTFEDVAVRVSEVGRTVGGRQVQSPDEECGHLTPRNVFVGAVLVVGRWIAPACDTGGRQLLDVLFEDIAVRVSEVGGPLGRRQPQSSNEECGHLAAGDELGWTEHVVLRRVATSSDVLLRQPGDVVVEYVAVGDIHESVRCHAHGRCHHQHARCQRDNQKCREALSHSLPPPCHNGTGSPRHTTYPDRRSCAFERVPGWSWCGLSAPPAVVTLWLLWPSFRSGRSATPCCGLQRNRSRRSTTRSGHSSRT